MRNELTPKETEVIELVADGLYNKEIAARLGISIHTVKCHLHNVYMKLKIKNRNQLVVKIFELNRKVQNEMD